MKTYTNFSLLLRTVVTYLIVFPVCFSTLSCSSTDTVRPDVILNNVEAASENDKRNSLLLEQAIKTSHQVDYILGPEDLLEIDVFEVDELKRTARVSSSGFLRLPLVGAIKASGLTVVELETEISKRLEQYLQEPIVTVVIKDYRSQRVTVLGAVEKQQTLNITRQQFLLDILSASGGLTEEAGDICYIQRGSETVVVNLNELLIKGNSKLNIPILAEDVINVPRGGIVFIDGAVKNPGSFAIKGTVTLTQAIAMAKGFNNVAIRDQLKLYRNSGTDSMEIIDIDYDAILKEEVSDLVLQDKDVVIVPKNGVKDFFSGFVRSISGAVSIGGASIGAGL